MISLKPIKLKPAQLSIEQINTYINQSNTMNEITTPNDNDNKECHTEFMHPNVTAIFLQESFRRLFPYDPETNKYYEVISIACATKAVDLVLTETSCGNCKQSNDEYWTQVMNKLNELMLRAK